MSAIAPLLKEPFLSLGPTNVQARKLLQTLCKFIIPLAQSLDMKAIRNLDDIPLGFEARAFINELKSFLSGARPRKKDCSLTFRTVQSKRHKYKSIYKIKDPLDYLEGTDWFWEKGSSSSLAETCEISAEGDSVKKLEVRRQFLHHRKGEVDELEEHLQILREEINLKMPIRVLGVEPFGSKFKISLLDQNAVYDHLSRQLQAYRNETGYVSDTFTWIMDHVNYAILSHTWTQTPGELTYVDWQKELLDSDDPKCQKVINFCKAAYENHGLTFGWVDTVCINKESSSELNESIRSMYKWYSRAKVCITYLGETNTLSNMARDPWFTRGWTFQELVAPKVVKFYNKDWKQLVPSKVNDKVYPPILESIQSATQITPTELEDISGVSISRRMGLAVRRKVTREEDTAYSLMGIFDVSISTAYGEGEERAFFRLLKEIFDTNKDVSDIFNWGGRSFSSITSLFPQTIRGYIRRPKDPNLRPWRPLEPLTLTHLGLRTPVLLMSASDSDSGWRPIGDYHATVSYEELLVQKTYYLLQNKRFEKAIGTLNVAEHSDKDSVRISKTCFAILLDYERDGQDDPGRYKRSVLSSFIVFNLQKVGSAGDAGGNHYYVVRKDQLKYHGMKLVTLYL